MTERPVEQRPMMISDPQVMRALAHPARLGIMEHLSTTGAAVTATECAEIVGLSPSAVSYHLRELAKFGLVEQAPSRGDARERLWRSGVGSWGVEAGHSVDRAGRQPGRVAGGEGRAGDPDRGLRRPRHGADPAVGPGVPARSRRSGTTPPSTAARC
ncbi:ArsR/SmtB family transcription factor [Plantactinospora sp. WMMC1484]|uniref:ArsR/SmtB family transcription factor n=1 Tax=Plantactinospora sp. WMMC1484 TaxID=3404122 RepID=UPI003BF480BC